MSDSKSKFPKTYRVGLWWTMSGGAFIALLAGRGALTEASIIGLALAGAIATTLAAWEHGWLKGFSRSLLVLVVTWVGMAILAWFVWPVQAFPVLEASYGIVDGGLPIAIQPGNDVDLILLHQDRTVRVENTVNMGSGTPFLWPTGKKISPPEIVGKIELSNQNATGLFDVTYSINIKIGAESDPKGISTQHVDLPLVDLPAGKSAEFYVVNQSSWVAMIEFLQNCKARIQGQPERVTVNVEPRDITMWDKLPVLPMSFHKWSGDQILDPDQWKKTESHPKQR